MTLENKYIEICALGCFLLDFYMVPLAIVLCLSDVLVHLLHISDRIVLDFVCTKL